MQCPLKAAMPQRMLPLYVNEGQLHFNVSSASGQPACTTPRRYVRIGLAKSADFAMYASMRRSRLPMRLLRFEDALNQLRVIGKQAGMRQPRRQLAPARFEP